MVFLLGGTVSVWMDFCWIAQLHAFVCCEVYVMVHGHVRPWGHFFCKTQSQLHRERKRKSANTHGDTNYHLSPDKVKNALVTLLWSWESAAIGDVKAHACGAPLSIFTDTNIQV